MLVEFDLQDIELAVGLDDNHDGAIVWSEYRDKQHHINAYIQNKVRFSSDNIDCVPVPLEGLNGIIEGTIPSLRASFRLNCTNDPEVLTLDHQLLTNIDISATALLTVVGSGSQKSLLVVPGSHRIDITDTDFIRANVTFLKQGIHHILIGFDHLAFLLLLILPAARQGSLKQCLSRLAGIITAFTLAHSVTLILSASGHLNLATKPIEITIAASVIVAGLINLAHPTHRMSWIIAYGFGLVHGFGFAAVLTDLADSENLGLANLAAFNIGVEIGQLAIVALLLPILLLLSSNLLQYRQIVRALSLGCCFVGSIWVLERLG